LNPQPLGHEPSDFTTRPVVLNLFKAATPFNYEFLFATQKTK
jgi:hypothetical protein